MPAVRASNATTATRSSSFQAAGRGGGSSGRGRGRGGRERNRVRERDGAAATGRDPQDEPLNEEEINAVHASILIWHRRLQMDAASTRLAVLSLQAQGAAGDMDIAEIDVITTMERYCMMGQNNRILAHFEGKGETPGVVKDISSIEGKLPTILPRLVPSNVVEDGGKAFLRSIAQQAFLCVSVPAYDASNHYISDTALAYAKHKPEELGTNGKHLLSPTNKKGKQNVLVIIQEKINSMRFDIRKLVHESIEAEKNLKELVEDVQASCPEMEVTWEFTEYVALWRRTGVTNGCKKEGGDWNNKFWTQHDERLHNYLENCKAGDAGDEEKRKEAEDYIYDVIVHDEEQFGECPRPERRATCDVQTLFSNIFANGIASNV